MTRALIVGIMGQDGFYLARHLGELGYEVFGLARRRDPERQAEIAEALPHVTLVDGDLTDAASLIDGLQHVAPDEVYNLAAISYVPASWSDPERVTQVNALGALRLLEALCIVGGRGWQNGRARNRIRFFQAGSSEMFGQTEETPQHEETAFRPQTPYAVTKVYAHHLTALYRQHHGIFACNGILFNHESPRRPSTFVTRKITQSVARIALGLQQELVLGNLEARRDWGFAGDFVRAMHLMLQHDEPGDYVVGTGESHSVREFVEIAFAYVGLDWRDYVRVDPEYFRPAEPRELRADSSKAHRVLGWQPTLSFRELVETMVRADLEHEREASARLP